MSTSVRRALYGKMAGDTTLNGLLATPPSGWSKSIYHREAPDSAGYPLVIFQKQSGVPTYTMQSGRSAYESDVWLVKAIDRNTTADPAEAVQARLETLLLDATLSISGEELMYLRRESDVEFSEVSDGVTYQHAGALWRLMHQVT